MKSIIITGASGGLGAATARLFLEKGWRVGLLARNKDKLEALADGHERAVVLPCDVTDEGSIERAFAAFDRPLDALFNNAGTFGKQALIDEITVAEWRHTVDVNLTGMFLAARAAFTRMRTQDPTGGRIINNGSISAHTPRPQTVGYTATKHAVTGLTKTLALDGRPFQIACGQIDIGNAASAMTESMSAGVPQADGSIAPEPVMSSDHVAEAVLHMAELPLSANILNMTVMATNMPFVGRG
ncbi:MULTISPECIES: SDR family oxidoreductase [Halocynthiibacter]|uniref:SDR family oxidoreductase n=1 Tax=Halocynthiibacter halioticoli TaxID=2986804 RepID=A0AAE3IX44_9RHOB|nr:MULTISPECIES: SDR family oxidoreductase [Halocynthiibacter]MCV6823614.1 SDR family oxidoreductase [Halocynthiibacter halioticoli]MCW4056615.1 SDR family oxidoreductase [Halocynthiibacter sp. SDUM655004]